MAKLKFDKLSIAELRDLRVELDKELESRDKKMSAIEDLKRMASERGIRLEDVLIHVSGERKRRTPLGPAPILYRHPKDSLLTWSGRGKQPRWVVKALQEESLKLEDLRISGQMAA